VAFGETGSVGRADMIKKVEDKEIEGGTQVEWS
jgi:hypothetical protein